MKTKQQLLSELFLTCIELNDDNFTLSFEYIHNDNSIVIMCYFGPWGDGDKGYSRLLEIKTDESFNQDSCDSIISNLNEIKKESVSESVYLAKQAEHKKQKRKEELLKELKELDK